jgi:hypothetical protein
MYPIIIARKRKPERLTLRHQIDFVLMSEIGEATPRPRIFGLARFQCRKRLRELPSCYQFHPRSVQRADDGHPIEPHDALAEGQHAAFI